MLLRQWGVQVVDKGGRGLTSVWPVFVHVPIHHGDRALDLLARVVVGWVVVGLGGTNAYAYMIGARVLTTFLSKLTPPSRTHTK